MTATRHPSFAEETEYTANLTVVRLPRQPYSCPLEIKLQDADSTYNDFVADMTAAFSPVDPTLQTSGTFDCFRILQLFRHLWICAQTHEYPASTTMNMLYLLCDPAFYGNFTPKAYPAYYFQWPEMPPHCANYSNCNNDNKQASFNDAQSWARKLSFEAKYMHKALKKRTYLYLPAHIHCMGSITNCYNTSCSFFHHFPCPGHLPVLPVVPLLPHL